MNGQRGLETASNILIVDNKQENLSLLSQILEKQGNKVRSLNRGKAVMDDVFGSPPDIILLDVVLPDMDAFEVGRRLKADNRTRDIPVIFIGALAEIEDKLKGFSIGGVDYITKPIRESEVLLRVNTHLSMRKYKHELEIRNKKLQENEEKYRNLVDNAPDIIYRFSEKKGGFLVSRRVEEILGYTAEYLMNNPFVWNDSIHPEDKAVVNQAISEVNKGKSFDIDYRIKDKNGIWHWFRDRSIGIIDADGDIVIEGLASDITDGKVARQTIIDLNRKLKAAQHLTKSCWWEHDVKNDRLIWPDEALEIFGLNPESVETLEHDILRQRIHPEYREYHTENYQKLFEEGKGEIQFPILLQDGEIRWIWATGEVEYDVNGAPVRLFGTMQDITDRVEIEEQLRFQAQIIRQVHDSVITVNLDGMITSWNKGSERLFQYTADEAIGCHVSLIYPVESHDVLENEINPRLLSVRRLEMEDTLIRKDGQTFDGMLSLSILEDEKGEITGMIGYIIDISDRKQAERKLQESESKFRTLFDVAAFPMCHIDGDGVILDINAKFTQVFGYEKKDLPRIENWWLLAYPDPEYRGRIINTWEDAVNKAFTDGIDIETGEHNVQCKNGEVRRVMVSGAVFQGNFLGAFVDITERKRIEEALKESERNLATVLAHTQDGVVRIDRELKHIFANDAIYAATGLTPNEYLRKTNEEIGMPEEVSAFWREKHESVFRTGEMTTFEFTFSTVNRGERIFQAIVAPEFDEDGRVATIVSFMRDITELKQIESEKDALIRELETAIAEVKTLRGFIPICANCKQIRDDEGYWKQIEEYIQERSDARFSHGICPDCARKLYPGIYND